MTSPNTVALLSKVHLFGASLGGFLAQKFAVYTATSQRVRFLECFHAALAPHTAHRYSTLQCHTKPQRATLHLTASSRLCSFAFVCCNLRCGYLLRDCADVRRCEIVFLNIGTIHYPLQRLHRHWCFQSNAPVEFIQIPSYVRFGFIRPCVRLRVV